MREKPAVVLCDNTDTALEIYLGGFAPVNPAQNSAFHESLITRLIEAAKAEGWAGASFTDYQRREGFVSIGAKAGDGWPSINALRIFRTTGAAPRLMERGKAGSGIKEAREMEETKGDQ